VRAAGHYHKQDYGQIAHFDRSLARMIGHVNSRSRY
jgi:hypothetical protein